MLFNSYIFVFLFFPLVVFGYYAFHHWKKPQMALGWLLLMSMLLRLQQHRVPVYSDCKCYSEFRRGRTDEPREKGGAAQTAACGRSWREFGYFILL